ncbi:hypothetical protein P9126_06655 [Bacillus glycinifermentans]|uniref:hypothetical protein n=1 Tax=Bacillus glycinifermentans TaxID=1664069 RepID=UPI002DB94F82|nr:hypothetical protein [Bacillus glycinifermentans]MEC3606677.1 hypothetical protein [Bacillus glycinifermentans]
MAKLEGVKTLDMVNGEITKVSYNGAEYERVEGNARRVGKSGDLVLNGHRHPDLKLGEFYLLVRDEGTSWLSVRDEVDDFHGNAVTDGNSILFRKVSASQPSLEARVSTNEKDIAALKSDVAALKGEAEPKYVRIAIGEAKAGDFVKFDEAPNEYLTAGKFYGIYRVDDCGDPRIHDDEGDDFDTYGEAFEVYRKVSAASVEAEPKPERLKVGDYAKVDYTFNSQSKRGDIVKITEDDNSIIPFLTEHLNGDNAGWFAEDPLVRATDEEVAEAKRKQAEEEERKRWAAIGREVGEYKKGDVVCVTDPGYSALSVGDIGTVGNFVSNAFRVNVRGVSTSNWLSPVRVKLIAPVEARFDRNDE